VEKSKEMPNIKGGNHFHRSGAQEARNAREHVATVAVVRRVQGQPAGHRRALRGVRDNFRDDVRADSVRGVAVAVVGPLAGVGASIHYI
jgi:mannose/fructose/N-acetylgalactosamine-specific phosphotransferase system component IID